MGRPSLLLTLAATLALSTALPAFAEQSFNRIATFPVAENLPADIDPASTTSSEIITATEDGNTLIYSDSPLGAIGFVDITDPKAPKAGGIIKVEGEPTSVVVVGGNAIAGVNTSESKANPSGKLLLIDIAGKSAEDSCALAGQPDSVAISKDKRFLAVAIENERDEDVNDGEIPQMPAGTLQIFSLDDGAPDCSSAKTVDLTGIAEVAPEDPEPEFVDINENGEIALTLQENNHIVIVSADTGEIVGHFSAGSASIANVDLADDGALRFDRSADNLLREPDTVQWLDNDRLLVANEGDYKGGSRGFTIFSKAGEVLFDSGSSLEHQTALVGHYPEGRSDAKGVEPEGAETAVYGDQRYFFVTMERASAVAVYRDTGAEPQFVQILPSGIGPEGVLAIPQRNLLVTANEEDLGEDGAARSHVMVYELGEGAPVYPMIRSVMQDGRPIGWGALSALAADPSQPGHLYAASDSVYGAEPAIFVIDATGAPAEITRKIIVRRGEAAAQKLDIEGLVADGEGGFWLASEGDSSKLIPHALYHVDGEGVIDEEIGLPAELLANEQRYGFEGITMIGEGDDLTLVMAVQREWKDDPKGEVKLLAYKPESEEWSAVRYPLDATEQGWVGLSEITAHDGALYIIERDNLIGTAARNKRLYKVALDSFKPAALDADLPVVEKTLVRDLIADIRSAMNGYVVDKVEGFTIDAAGEAYFVTDNDGVDDSSGETIFVKLGRLDAVN